MSTQLSTQALHAGHDVIKSQGTQAVPIYQTTSYVLMILIMLRVYSLSRSLDTFIHV